jgi:glucokinase
LLTKAIETFESNQQVKSSIVVGVDIGGSHVTAAAVNLETRLMVQNSWIRERVDAHSEPRDIIAAWSKAISKSASVIDKKSYQVGLGIPGPFDYENGISLIKGQDKYDQLYGLNVKTLLSETLGIDDRNIRMMNDAACFLKGEVFCGSGQGFNKTIGLTLGTGLGSSVSEHHEVADLDLWRSPFKDSIAEDYLSTRWFVKRYNELSGNTINDVFALSEMAANNSFASLVFKEFGSNLGQFLSTLVEAQNPDAIILGGNISQAFHLFGDSLMEYLSVFDSLAVRRATLGEDAAIIGASSLWSDSMLLVDENEESALKSS